MITYVLIKLIIYTTGYNFLLTITLWLLLFLFIKYYSKTYSVTVRLMYCFFVQVDSVSHSICLFPVDGL